jgi:hypothetical protein
MFTAYARFNLNRNVNDPKHVIGYTIVEGQGTGSTPEEAAQAAIADGFRHFAANSGDRWEHIRVVLA